MLKWILLVFVLLYVVIINSPLPKHIGRTNPSLAAMISPYFNFGEYYENGTAYGFEIGSNIDVVAEYLLSQNQPKLRFNNVGRAQSHDEPQIVTFNSTNDLITWGIDQPVWSVYGFGSSELYVGLYFSNGKLVKIRLTKTNFEAI